MDAGQVWRAAWGDVSLLVAVTQIEDADVGVIPLTLEPVSEDDRCLVLAPSLTVFGVEATLWMDLASTLPLRVLDEIIDKWPEDVTRAIAAAADYPTSVPGAGMRRGEPAETEFDYPASVRAEIEDDLVALRAAPALPTEVKDQEPVRTLAAVLGKGVDLPSLVTALSALDLDQPDVMNLLRGKRPMSPQVVDVVVAVTGIDRDLVAESVQPLPHEFVIEVDHPRWRPVWQARALRDGTDETTARLRASYEMFAVAARQTGSRKPDWSARLAQFRSFKDEQGTP
ncbi:hypothetical protein [Rhodococcus sp. 27YEA6]|uniref:hypothetical protein n=1 Tax=Rhodococcus sp. 27YEA6 TaxID=3156273 RepID=UPI00384F38AF